MEGGEAGPSSSIKVEAGDGHALYALPICEAEYIRKGEEEEEADENENEKERIETVGKPGHVGSAQPSSILGRAREPAKPSIGSARLRLQASRAIAWASQKSLSGVHSEQGPRRHGCSVETTIDERGNPLQGKRLGVHEYWEHCRGDKRLRYMSYQSDDLNNAPPTTAPATRHYDTSQEDELAQSLGNCLSIFRSGLHQDIRTEDLVFCEPSESDASDTRTPPPLQSLAVTNAQFLEYRDWVMKLYMDADSLDCGTFERCRAIQGQLLNELRNEWARLDELKLQAWRMDCQNSLSAMVPRPDYGILSCPGLIDSGQVPPVRVVDTSPHFAMSLSSPGTEPVVVVAHILVAVVHMKTFIPVTDGVIR
ncbi:hypothetical protein BC826DRAFT_972997 [Russula brevipes]|nr:hypothetical protein BC826DRAFT_972997 [Russula brevipes]